MNALTEKQLCALRNPLNTRSVLDAGSAAIAHIAELTRERDEARAANQALRQADPNTLAQAAKIRELSRALTDAEAERCSEPYECWKDLRAEVTRLTEALAAEKQRRAEADRMTLGHVQAKLAAEARVRELEERVSQALTGLRPGSPVREALEEALRAP